MVADKLGLLTAAFLPCPPYGVLAQRTDGVSGGASSGFWDWQGVRRRWAAQPGGESLGVGQSFTPRQVKASQRGDAPRYTVGPAKQAPTSGPARVKKRPQHRGAMPGSSFHPDAKGAAPPSGSPGTS
jgi:hypothetical protein